MNWHNVSKKEPCPICHKTDWCNLSDDGAVCICHRVESPYLARSGSGWIHRLIDRPVNHFTRRPTCCCTLAVSRPTAPQSPATLDLSRVHSSYSADPILVDGLATTLGVDPDALAALEVRYNALNECWSFPMRDADGKIVGLRFRELAGSRKWSARGSKDGLFYSAVHLHLSPSPKELVIVEGPSDTAAALSLFSCCSPLVVPVPPSVSRPDFAGLRAREPHSPTTYLPVGRSSCQTGSAHLRALIRRVRPRIITIVADNDAPGIKGAELLAQQLISHPSSPIPHPYYAVRVLTVPAPYKDLRAWYLSNTLTPRLFADLTSAQRWQ